MTHGTAIVASAVRHDGICQEAATAGAAENRALRRREDFTTEVGKGAAKSAAGIRYVGPQTAASATQTMAKTSEPMSTENAATAYRRTSGR